MASEGESISQLLPPSLNLPPHLSAHKYFLVCTLTVAAWDALVLSPRTWRLFYKPGWSSLKALFHVIRVWVLVEFIIVAVAFFDTKMTQQNCSHFYLFEPICTALLLAIISVAHTIRITAIYERNREIMTGLSALLTIQIVITAVACGFYRSIPLEVGQGCIAGPKHNWVGMYWVAPTLFYTVSFALAVIRSIQSLEVKPMGLWDVTIRDGLHFYCVIWALNMANMLFWFLIKTTGPEDPIRTITTSMTVVLTTSMTLRIILAIRGPLQGGGTLDLSYDPSSGAGNAPAARSAVQTHFSIAPQNIDLSNMRTGKPEVVWATQKEKEWADNKSSVTGIEVKPDVSDSNPGIQVTVDHEIDMTHFTTVNQTTTSRS